MIFFFFPFSDNMNLLNAKDSIRIAIISDSLRVGCSSSLV